MKKIFISFVLLLASVGASAKTTSHAHYECVTTDKDVQITRVQILHTVAETKGRYFLKAFAKNKLVLKAEVEYEEDMTYIVYYNNTVNVSLMLDYPPSKDHHMNAQLSFGDNPRYLHFECVETEAGRTGV